MYYSIEQVCQKLDKNERQIRYMINQGRMKPINPDTFRRDGGYRFSEEEVQRVKNEMTLPGFSVKEAAREIGITPQYLLQFVSSGDIKSDIKWIGQKRRRYFDKEEIQRFKSFLSKERETNRTGEYGVRVQLISREVRIFEKCLYDGLESIIINVNPFKVLTENGDTVYIENIDLPKSPWPNHSYIRTKGHVEFEMPIPRHPHHPVYQLLYKMIEEIGERNIQIFETQYGDYFVRCRLGKIRAEKDEHKLLLKYMVKGEMEYENGLVYLQSSDLSKNITLPKGIWKDVEKAASSNGENIHEIVRKALENYVH